MVHAVAVAIGLLIAGFSVSPEPAFAGGWRSVTQPPPTDRIEAQAQPAAPHVRMEAPPARRRHRDFDYGFTMYAGKSATSNFTSLFYAPWNVEFEDTHLLAIAGSKRLGTIWWDIDVDVELNAAKRFGDDDAWEFATTLFFRYDDFPWNDVVYTTLGVGVGPSYATHISDTEKTKAGNGDKGSKFLNAFIPELTVSTIARACSASSTASAAGPTSFHSAPAFVSDGHPIAYIADTSTPPGSTS
jgi:hypothetical protein